MYKAYADKEDMIPPVTILEYIGIQKTKPVESDEDQKGQEKRDPIDVNLINANIYAQ